jgi:hypothetical protein
MMCDYSLYEFPNRLAREGEELVTYRFPSGSIGLASPMDLPNREARPSGMGFWAILRSFSEARARARNVCAVCVPPGTRVILKGIPDQVQKDLGVGPEEGGTFIETSADLHRHRDAVQLTNGRLIPLQQLCPGQSVEILSMVPVGEFLETTTERTNALTF